MQHFQTTLDVIPLTEKPQNFQMVYSMEFWYEDGWEEAYQNKYGTIGTDLQQYSLG